MWERLSEVDWDRLDLADGKAGKVPGILYDMVSFDEPTREAGWEAFREGVNGQGEYFDSTVAAIPFLIEAAGRADVPERIRFLEYFFLRWEQAAACGGDPVIDEPPGGIDIPTPLRAEAPEAPEAPEDPNNEGFEPFAGYDPEDPVDPEVEGCEVPASDAAGPDPAQKNKAVLVRNRRMDLCAWQVGRAIRRGMPTYLALLHEPDRKIVAAAALLLLTWRETRAEGKHALLTLIEDEIDPVEAAERILELGVYGTAADIPHYRDWIEPYHAAVVRAAAALAWARTIAPAPLPAALAEAVRETSDPACDAFGKLPAAGINRRGLCFLPAALADLPLRLAENLDDYLRWNAVEALAGSCSIELHWEGGPNPDYERGGRGMSSLLAGRAYTQESDPTVVVRVLLRSLSDANFHVRAIAAGVLVQRGTAVASHAPDALPVLVRALDDENANVCGDAGRLLVMLSVRLSPELRAEALAAVRRASRRFEGCIERIHIGPMALSPSNFLREMLKPLADPIRWSVLLLLGELGMYERRDFRLPPEECERALADAYRRDPAGTFAVAVGALAEGSCRVAALGAAEWFLSLGPAAAAALPALDAAANGSLDDFARYRLRTAAELLRRMGRVPSEPPASVPAPASETASAFGGCSDHPRSKHRENTPAGEPREIAEHPTESTPRTAVGDVTPAAPDFALAERQLDSPLEPSWGERLARLSHPDPAIRAETAERSAEVPPPAEFRAELVARLEGLLADDAVAEVGIFGEFLHAGRLHHWRMERRSPRAAAIRARLALEPPPVGETLLRAMLTAVRQPATLCGRHACPHRFSLAEWSTAAEAVGGPAVAERLARAALQEHLALLRTHDIPDLAPPDPSEPAPQDVPDLVPLDDLAEIVRHLSGRLV